MDFATGVLPPRGCTPPYGLGPWRLVVLCTAYGHGFMVALSECCHRFGCGWFGFSYQARSICSTSSSSEGIWILFFNFSLFFSSWTFFGTTCPSSVMYRTEGSIISFGRGAWCSPSCTGGIWCRLCSLGLMFSLVLPCSLSLLCSLGLFCSLSLPSSLGDPSCSSCSIGGTCYPICSISTYPPFILIVLNLVNIFKVHRIAYCVFHRQRQEWCGITPKNV